MDIKTFALVLLGLGVLPSAVALLLLRVAPIRYQNKETFTLVYSGVMLGWIALFILWSRRGYGRRWQHFRARSWRQVAGRFDDGDIVTMKKGHSEKIAGYQVWLAYEYSADGDQVGVYTLPFVGEFPSEEAAEEYRKRAANQNVVVRVSPRNPKRSCVFDEDVRLLVGDHN